MTAVLATFEQPDTPTLRIVEKPCGCVITEGGPDLVDPCWVHYEPTPREVGLADRRWDCRNDDTE
jgi:hypothetical protein